MDRISWFFSNNVWAIPSLILAAIFIFFGLAASWVFGAGLGQIVKTFFIILLVVGFIVLIFVRIQKGGGGGGFFGGGDGGDGGGGE